MNTRFEHKIDNSSTLRIYIRSNQLRERRGPDSFENFFIRKFIKKSITCKINKNIFLYLLPKMIKSDSSLIWNEMTVGVEMSTPGLPPNSGNLASKSPNERET